MIGRNGSTHRQAQYEQARHWSLSCAYNSVWPMRSTELMLNGDGQPYLSTAVKKQLRVWTAEGSSPYL